MSESNPLITRLRMRLDQAQGMKHLDELVLKNSYLHGAPYSFNDHEWQQEVIRDPSSRIALRKCSQVGASEMAIAKTLALMTAFQHIRVIYTLPTQNFANSFSKDRFDNAIDQSPTYSSLLKAANNSASQKQLGTSILYVSGSYGSNAGISIPATVLVNDEVDFSNPVVIGKLSSRLRHAEIEDEHGQRGIRYTFSTPTTDGVGVDEAFIAGTQAYYAVRCRHCETWQIPSFLKDFHIPGFTGDPKDFSREDALNLDLSRTTILCPKCHKDLLSSLADSSRRQWIKKFPDRPQQSYQVSPWDVIKYNKPSMIVSQILDYPLKSDFYNFVLGLPYSDADNTFNTSPVHKQRVATVPPLKYPSSVISNYFVIGMDVGKVCHMVVGLPVGKSIHVVNAIKIRNDRDDPALPKIMRLFQFYKCVSMVMDAGPDITLVNEATRSSDEIWACVYQSNMKGPRVIQEKDKEQVINVDRTKAFTLLLDKFNAGDIHFPKGEAVTDEMFKHIATTRKIRRQNQDGSFTELFVANSKEDHWLHALNYCHLAMERKFGQFSESGIMAPVGVSTAKLGGNIGEKGLSLSRSLV